MTNARTIRDTFEQGHGILRLIPAFVPRKFGKAGHRLRLHPDDYYAAGMNRGAITERWFTSVTSTLNGPLAPLDEGMSYVSFSNRVEDKFLFKDAVDELGVDLIGRELKDKYNSFPVFAKFFDYETPLFHHLHLGDIAASLVGKTPKPEAYYFPHQLNNHPGQFPVTYFGFDPSTTMDEVRERIADFEKLDTRITELSRAYRIQLGTGWYVPPGVIHAPGSYLTYEPQWNSDVSAVFENVASGEVIPYESLAEHCPDDRRHDIDYILSLLDWEKNVDPLFKEHYYRPPIVCMDEPYEEMWITYGNVYFSAKELTIPPGRTVVVKDGAAYGCVVIEGYGRLGRYQAAAPIMIRYGALTSDEFFVSEQAAKEGVTVTNLSLTEPLVMLKHFGPNNPGVPVV
ncbi:hypothetical protein [Alicyclobacillus dauci]|uniref:Mannose-6-phosphate isomerase, class I n=1 Tax=Alicyclobacillus dauci TaxID=1475485 RepID=A0ABY6Z2J1_9BACL|nr:hypothetical protein [Alicyclobacillus dauci]WAH37052.1 hypothetical protein NZD86_00260 [Alicyclobacillus dauci]